MGEKSFFLKMGVSKLTNRWSYDLFNFIILSGGIMRVLRGILFLCVCFLFSGGLSAQTKESAAASKTTVKPAKVEAAKAAPVVKNETKSKAVVMPQMPGKIYVRPDGKIFVKSKTPLFLKLSTSAEAGEENYTLRNDANSNVKESVKPIYLEGHGQHTIVHPDEHKKVYNRKGHMFHVEDDGRAPTYDVQITKAPKAVTGKRIVYGKPVNISLSFQDADAGVHSAYFSLNQKEMVPYQQLIPLKAEKNYTLKFNAIDNVSNKTKTVVRYYALDFTPPVSRHIIEGYHYQNIVSPKAVIKLRARDEKAGVAKIFYRFKGKKGVYGNKALDMKGLKDGSHQLIYASVDRVKNAENNKTFNFYLDSIPPVVKSAISGDQYKKGKTTFVSARTRVSLSATDNKAGVRRIRYYLNKKKSGRVYQDAFGFPKKNGAVTLSYHASDRVLNIGKKVHKKVTVDVSAPSIRPSFKGEHYYRRKINYVRRSTKISFITKDNLSGVKSVKYQLDSGSEITDRKPFKISQPGMHEVAYEAVDNVNNTSENKKMSVFVDEKAPEIFNHFSVAQNVPGKEIYPLRAKLYLAATDKQSGIRSISYKINNKKTEKYYSAIKFIKAGKYKVTIKSVDNVGNVSSRVIKFRITKN